MLYTLNVYCAVGQLYLNKTERKKIKEWHLYQKIQRTGEITVNR